MQRGTPSGTATSAAPSRGTSLQPSRRAARAGYSAVRSGDDVKIALSTSSGWKPVVSWSARNSSAVASRIAWAVLAGAVVAPRSPRRVLLMALAGQLRLMVITDAGVLKGRDPVEACRRAVAGGATMIQVRLKDAPPEEVVALARALVGALAVPVIVNDRVDVALAAGAAGAHLGQEDPPLDRLRSHVRSEEHTSELQSRLHLVCRLLLEKKKTTPSRPQPTRTPSSSCSSYESLVRFTRPPAVLPTPTMCSVSHATPVAATTHTTLSTTEP